jgi:predicted site-specific integrase-resolvase
MSTGLPKSTLMTPQDVAIRLGISIATLATWRCTQRYALTYVKIGRLVRYRLSDVEAFEASRSHEVAGV